MKRLYWLFCIILVFICVITIVIVFLLSISHKSSKKESNKIYQYFEINLHNLNESKYGTARLTEDLKNDFLSYGKKDSNKYIVISNFGNKEYECHGSCFCEPSGRRYLLPSLINQGLILLFTTFSVSLAIKTSQIVFQKSCEEKYSGSCETPSKINAEVDNCQEIEDDIDDIISSDSDREFFCDGHCVTNRKLRESWHDKIINFGSCNKLEFSGSVQVPFENIKISEKSHFMIYAKVEFAKKHLGPFCKAGSKSTIIVKSKSSNRGYSFRKRKSSLCVANSSVEQYSNIICKKKEK